MVDGWRNLGSFLWWIVLSTANTKHNNAVLVYGLSVRASWKCQTSWDLKMSWHQQRCATCQDVLKNVQNVPNFRPKNILLSVFFLFLTMCSSCSKDSKNSYLVCPTYKNSPKIDVATNYNAVRISQHFGLLLTCCQHVDDISKQCQRRRPRFQKYGCEVVESSCSGSCWQDT